MRQLIEFPQVGPTSINQQWQQQQQQYPINVLLAALSKFNKEQNSRPRWMMQWRSRLLPSRALGRHQDKMDIGQQQETETTTTTTGALVDERAENHSRRLPLDQRLARSLAHKQVVANN